MTLNHSKLSLFFFCLQAIWLPDTMASDAETCVVSNATKVCKQIFHSRVNKSGTFESSRLFINRPNAVGTNAALLAVKPFNTNYDGHVKCRYEFYGEPNELIQIKFHDFVIPSQRPNSSVCKVNDSLQLLTQVRGKYEPMEYICGSFLPKPIMSSGPSLTLQYVGQYPNVTKTGFYYGFKAEYRFLKNFGIFSGTQQGTGCTFLYNSTERKTGAFHSPNFPGFYLENVVCNYLFFGTQEERVVIRFTHFDVEGLGRCDFVTASDYVEFSNFMTTDRKFSKHCGKLDNFEVRSDSRFFRVTLHSNDRFVGVGFRAYYEFEKLSKIHESENASSMQSYMSSTASYNIINLDLLLITLVIIFSK